jgi:hypothetical protein
MRGNAKILESAGCESCVGRFPTGGVATLIVNYTTFN